MTAYYDASALVKLVIEEPESTALRRFVTDAELPSASSVLVRTEVLRVVGLTDGTAVARAREVLDRLDSIPVTRGVVDMAGELGVQLRLRSLDAIHVASALELGEVLDVVVTYDQRMAEGARALGLRVESPA